MKPSPGDFCLVFPCMKRRHFVEQFIGLDPRKQCVDGASSDRKEETWRYMNYCSCSILEQRSKQMAATAVCSSPISLKISKTESRVTKHHCYTESKAKLDFPLRKCCNVSIGTERRRSRKIAAMDDVPVVIDSAPVELTWQIVVGAIAGVTPFVVAGIEFSKRIIAQRSCEECGGSGLVLKEKDYFRCPQCGGFLPWQSWKRFFSGNQAELMH